MACCDGCDADIDLGRVGVGSVDRLRFTIRKDGAAWTGIDSVTLTFTDPDGNRASPVSATLETPDAGVWYYDTLTTTVDEAGAWSIGLTVVDGSVTKIYPGAVGFTAEDRA